jgi:hypothetical protein
MTGARAVGFEPSLRTRRRGPGEPGTDLRHETLRIARGLMSSRTLGRARARRRAQREDGHVARFRCRKRRWPTSRNTGMSDVLAAVGRRRERTARERARQQQTQFAAAQCFTLPSLLNGERPLRSESPRSRSSRHIRRPLAGALSRGGTLATRKRHSLGICRERCTSLEYIPDARRPRTRAAIAFAIAVRAACSGPPPAKPDGHAAHVAESSRLI